MIRSPGGNSLGAYRQVGVYTGNILKGAKPTSRPSSSSSYAGRDDGAREGHRYRTPSFFCRLEDEVVYWNTRRLSG